MKCIGIVRRSSLFNRGRIDRLFFNRNNDFKDKLHLHYGDLGDSNSLNLILNNVKPDEVYNLAARVTLLLVSRSPNILEI